MANTTNYNWETPDDTDLVKDGAAAIRTLGSSIDTTTKNLNPETTTGDIAYRSATANTNTRLAIGSTGQVLTVAGGVPSWATPTTGDIEGVTAGTGISGGGTSGTVTITNSMATAIDAKGDLVVGTGADTFSRLAVGTNNYVLTADSAEATGLKWAAASGGASFVGCKLKKTALTFTVAHNTATALSFDSEEYDTDAFHDNSTNNTRITIPSGKGGKYLFVGTTRVNSLTSGDLILFFAKNGTQINVAIVNNPADGTTLTTEYLNLTAGDYIELKAFQNSGSTKTFEGTDSAVILTSFSCQYLGA